MASNHGVDVVQAMHNLMNITATIIVPINAAPKIAFFLLNEPHMEQLMLFYANNPLFTF